MSEDNTLVSTASRAAEASGYDTARRGAAFFDRADRGFIVVSGKDRASYLHGLLTNEIAGLKAGEGCYAAYLTPQGRMIADLWVYELGDVILLVMSRDVKDAVLSKLQARLDKARASGRPRSWRVGEDFENVARRFAGDLRVPTSVIQRALKPRR